MGHSGGRVFPVKLPTAPQSATALSLGASGADYVRIMGWDAQETAGHAVVITLRAGSATGPLVGVINLAGNAAMPLPAWFGPQGIQIPAPLFVAIVGASAVVDGSVYLG